MFSIFKIGDGDDVKLAEVNVPENVVFNKDIEIKPDQSNLNEIFLKSSFRASRDMRN